MLLQKGLQFESKRRSVRVPKSSLLHHKLVPQINTIRATQRSPYLHRIRLVSLPNSFVLLASNQNRKIHE